jgi:hypothetical protein
MIGNDVRTLVSIQNYVKDLMALVYKKENVWHLNGSKHRGKTLAEVAKTDPGYIWWIWHKIGPSMADETYYAVEDAMYKNSIPFNKSKK